MGSRSLSRCLACVALLVACGKDDETASATGSATPTQTTSNDGGLCARWPAAAETFDAATHVGCTPKPTSGSNTNVCDAGTEYALICNEASPDPGLDCRVAAIPPSGPQLCCPCRP